MEKANNERLEPPPANRWTVKQGRGAARYDRETIYPILDAANVCHVGFVVDDQPFVIPTNYVRIGDKLVFHGSTTSRMMKHLDSNQCCVSVTLVDGLIVARSLFHHAVAYRSVVVFGEARWITDTAAKLDALIALSEHILPGRTKEARWPNDKELGATAIVEVSIDDASAKVRDDMGEDNPSDMGSDAWAGVVPIKSVFGTPIANPTLRPSIELPASIVALTER